MKRAEFSELVKVYRYQLYVVAYSVLKNEDDAQDAVCQAVLNAYEHLDQLKSDHKFKAWMIAITRNEALHMRQKRMELPGNEAVHEMLEPVNDTYDELWDIVQNLKEEYRMVVVLFYYNDLSLREIATVLDIPIGTVKSRLKRGRDFLKKALDGKEG